MKLISKLYPTSANPFINPQINRQNIHSKMFIPSTKLCASQIFPNYNVRLIYIILCKNHKNGFSIHHIFAVYLSHVQQIGPHRKWLPPVGG